MSLPNKPIFDKEVLIFVVILISSTHVIWTELILQVMMKESLRENPKKKSADILIFFFLELVLYEII